MAITLAVAVVSVKSCHTTFTTSDEAYAARALAGFFTDRPMVWVPFLSPVLTRVLYVLYRFIPGIAWYAWLERLLMLVSATVVNACVLRQTARAFGKKGMAAGAVASLCLSGLYAWAFTRMSSYYTVGLCGVAMCLLILEGFDRERFLQRWLLAFALFFFGVGLLPHLGLGLLCALLLALACHLLGAPAKPGRRRRRQIVRSASLVVAATVVLAGTLVFDNIERNRLCDPRYDDWDALRNQYLTDGLISYDQYPEQYSAAGWSKDYRGMVLGHYFMDKRFSAQKLSKVLSNGAPAYRGAPLSGPVELFSGTKDSADALKGLAILGHGLLLLCVSLCVLAGGKKGKVLALTIYVLALDAAWLLLRRQWGLDFYRLFVLASPCLFLMISDVADSACRLIAARRDDGEGPAEGWKRLRGIVLLAVIGAVAAVFGFAGYSFGADNLLSKEKVAVNYELDREREDAIWEYASDHPNQKVIYHWSVLTTADPFRTAKCGTLVNLFCDDRMGLYTYCYNEQLRLNGRTKPLQSVSMSRDDVVFLSGSREIGQRLLSYLNAKYRVKAGVVELELESSLPVISYEKECDVDQVFYNAESAVCIMACQDRKIGVYVPAASVLEGEDPAKLRWLREGAYTVYYHLDETAEASDAVTRIVFGKVASILTAKELGFSKPGKKFAGWRVYWANLGCWRVVDPEGEKVWMKEPGEDETYVVYKDGLPLKNTVPAGDEVHLYAQWKNVKKSKKQKG